MHKQSAGFTLVELMIVVAIIAIISALAVPAYNNYIRESQFAAAKANVEPLRLMLEDYWLDNSDYGSGGANKAALLTNYNWQPDGDEGAYSYSVTASTNTYTIVVTHNSGRKVTCAKNADCTYE
jgi:prepilin-type N-terminal cleavage/methylation domain-containing protein